MLRVDTTSSSSKFVFNKLEPTPIDSNHGIEFPTTSIDAAPSETRHAQHPYKKFSCSLHHPALSRSTTNAILPVEPEGDSRIDLTRASLDRRISLPLLGIDLGRSGPSYGQTLKRMSVAVYGTASDAFVSQDMEVKDLIAGFKSPTRDQASGVTARCLMPDSRPSLSAGQSTSGMSSSSNDSTSLLANNENERIIPALHLSASTPLHLGRQSLQTSKAQTSKTQRELQARKLNLPFKANVKHPWRGVKLDSPYKFTSHSDAHLNGHAPTHAYENANLVRNSRNSLDSMASQVDETVRKTKMKKKRQVVQELIETERRYFDLLNKIQLNYIAPIQASQQANDHQKIILSHRTAIHIFSNFTAILGLSSQFLASLEKFGRDHGLFEQSTVPDPALPSEITINHPQYGIKCHSSTSYAPRGFNIGEIMIQFLPFFKLYTTFTSNFSVSQSTLHLHSAPRGPSPAFSKLLEDCRQRGVDGGLGLAHMLLGIIQRLPRYELLIKELVKHSIESDCDYNELISAQSMVGCVVRRLEIGMNEQTEAKTILTIQRAMEALPFPLVIPSRKLVKIGQLKKIGRKGDLQDRIFFLFNDCLIYSGTIRNGNAESVDKWLGQLTASFNTAPNLSARPASSTSIKPITTSFLLPFTYGDDNSPRLIFCRKMELHDVTTIGAVSGQKINSSTAFQIISSSKSFVVNTRNASEKDEWISCLRETKSELLDSRRTLFIKEELSLKFHKLGYIPESPSQEVVQLAFPTNKEGPNSNQQDRSADRTPQKARRETAPTFFPKLSHCKSPSAVTTSMISSLLSPRSRHTSTFSNAFALNWKNIVQLGHPPTARGTSHAEKDGPKSPKKPSEDNEPTERPSNVLTEPSLPPNKLSDIQAEPAEDQRSSASKYVAENYCAPVWVPDSDVNRCMGQCQTWFGVLKRRHHCRMCGGVFCSSCSSRMFVIANREQGDQIARACESCFKSVFLDEYSKDSRQPSEEGGSYRPILSNRLHDDQDLLFRKQRPYLKHSHRQSLPIDMGSAHFRHSLANIRDDDQRRSIVSAGTSVGGESVEHSKNDLEGGPKVNTVETFLQPSSNPSISTYSHNSPQTHARQRLSSLLQNHVR